MAATTGAYFEGISLTTTDQTPIDPTDADAVIIYSSDDGIIWTYVTDSDINPSVVWDPDIPDFLGGAGPASRNYQYNEFPDNQYIKLEIVPGGCGGDCSGIDGYDFYYPDEGTEFDWSSLGFMNPDSPTGNDLGSFTGNSYFKETFVVVYGCTDEAACNTCDNGCNTDDGTCEYEDDCGVCYGGNEDMDCTGVCFGDAAIDCAGDCCVNYNETPTYEWSDECVEEDILEPIYNTSCINYIWEYIGENAIEVRFTITNSDGVLIYDSHQLNGATSQTYNGPSLYVDGIEYNGWGYDLVPYDQEDTSNDNMHYRNKGLWGSICLPNGTYTVRTFDYDVYSDSSSRMMWTNLKNVTSLSSTQNYDIPSSGTIVMYEYDEAQCADDSRYCLDSFYYNGDVDYNASGVPHGDDWRFDSVGMDAPHLSVFSHFTMVEKQFDWSGWPEGWSESAPYEQGAIIGYPNSGGVLYHCDDGGGLDTSECVSSYSEYEGVFDLTISNPNQEIIDYEVIGTETVCNEVYDGGGYLYGNEGTACSHEDMCGTCDNDPSNDCVQDCNGEWGGAAEVDDCGICGGGNNSIYEYYWDGDGDGLGSGEASYLCEATAELLPCSTSPAGTYEVAGWCLNDDDLDDDCFTNDRDCAGECGGSAVTDNISGCCDESEISGCDENCNSTLEDDCAGVCGGDTVIDCSGECGGSAELDICGICGGDGPDFGFDCDGNCTLTTDPGCECGVTYNICGVCEGNSNDCLGCMNPLACNYDSDAIWDDGNQCEYPEVYFDCDGNCAVAVDCSGECGGDAIVDCAGICGGSAIFINCWPDDDSDGLGDPNYSSTEHCVPDGQCPDFWAPVAGDIDPTCPTSIDGSHHYDCAGDCCVDGEIYLTGGECLVNDECGVCGGDGSDDLGCGCFEPAAGECGCNTDVEDVCGICGGTATIGYDDCGVCDGENINMDDCGVCFGYNTDDLGCGCGEPGPVDYWWDVDGDGVGSDFPSQYCTSISTNCVNETNCSTGTGLPPDGWVLETNDPYPWCATNTVDDCGVCSNEMGYEEYFACSDNSIVCDLTECPESACSLPSFEWFWNDSSTYYVCVDNEEGIEFSNICNNSTQTYDITDNSTVVISLSAAGTPCDYPGTYGLEFTECPVLDECGICNGNGPEENYDCDGNCLLEIDCFGVCGGLNFDCSGCMDESADNYNPDAEIEDDSCLYLSQVSYNSTVYDTTDIGIVTIDDIADGTVLEDTVSTFQLSVNKNTSSPTVNSRLFWSSEPLSIIGSSVSFTTLNEYTQQNISIGNPSVIDVKYISSPNYVGEESITIYADEFDDDNNLIEGSRLSITINFNISEQDDSPKWNDISNDTKILSIGDLGDVSIWQGTLGEDTTESPTQIDLTQYVTDTDTSIEDLTFSMVADWQDGDEIVTLNDVGLLEFVIDDIFDIDANDVLIPTYDYTQDLKITLSVTDTTGLTSTGYINLIVITPLSPEGDFVALLETTFSPLPDSYVFYAKGAAEGELNVGGGGWVTGDSQAVIEKYKLMVYKCLDEICDDLEEEPSYENTYFTSVYGDLRRIIREGQPVSFTELGYYKAYLIVTDTLQRVTAVDEIINIIHLSSIIKTVGFDPVGSTDYDMTNTLINAWSGLRLYDGELPGGSPNIGDVFYAYPEDHIILDDGEGPTRQIIDEIDSDRRPNLGMWYYKEDQLPQKSGQWEGVVSDKYSTVKHSFGNVSGSCNPFGIGGASAFVNFSIPEYYVDSDDADGSIIKLDSTYAPGEPYVQEYSGFSIPFGSMYGFRKIYRLTKKSDITRACKTYYNYNGDSFSGWGDTYGGGTGQQSTSTYVSEGEDGISYGVEYSGGFVDVELGDTPRQTAENLVSCINHPNGHNGRILAQLVNSTIEDDTEIKLIQRMGGSNGNTSISTAVSGGRTGYSISNICALGENLYNPDCSDESLPIPILTDFGEVQGIESFYRGIMSVNDTYNEDGQILCRAQTNCEGDNQTGEIDLALDTSFTPTQYSAISECCQEQYGTTLGGYYFVEQCLSESDDGWSSYQCYETSYNETDGTNNPDSFSFIGGIDQYQFQPDFDVRTSMSINTQSGAVLQRYYDIELQPQEYMSSTAPAEVSFFFYSRDIEGANNNKRDIFNKDNTIEDFLMIGGVSTLYIGMVDWGDGSSEFYDKPKALRAGVSIPHIYNDAGIYEVTGYMFKTQVAPDASNTYSNQCVNYFKRFVGRINININPNQNGEFEILGGGGYTFLPHNVTVPIIGGVSENSIYVKSLKRQMGYITEQVLDSAEIRGYDWITDIDTTIPYIDINFNNIQYKIDIQRALAAVDESVIGEEMMAFYADYYKATSETAANLIYNESDKTPFGEFGDHIGDTDIGQVRYFSRVISMGELLGFDDLEANNPSSPRYWKNIIPETYNIFDREGTTIIRPSECVDIIGTPDEETDYETISTTCNENIDSVSFESYNYMSVNCCVKTEEDEILECTDDELQTVIMKEYQGEIELITESCIDYMWSFAGDYESDGIFFEIRDTETGNFVYGEKIEYSAEPEVLDADGNSLGGTYRNPYGEMCLYNGSYTIKLVAKLISTGWDADYWGQAGAITGYNEFGQPEGGHASWDDKYDDEDPFPRPGRLFIFEKSNFPTRVEDPSSNDWPYIDAYTSDEFQNKILYELRGPASDSGDGATQYDFGDDPDASTEWRESGIEYSYQDTGAGTTHAVTDHTVKEWQLELYSEDAYSSTVTSEYTYFYNTGEEACNSLLDEDEIQTTLSIEVNEDSNQDWIGQNEYGNIYYYPVLPKLDMFGKFNEDFGLQIDSSTTAEKIPFGDREWWDDEDLSTSTNVEFEYDDTLIIDLSFDTISNKTIEDLSGNNNIGILISDYQILFDEQTQKPSSNGISNTPKIGKIGKGKAF